MTARCVRRTLFALLLSGIAATALAGGLERYRVTLALQPGDDIQVVTSQLAGTYRLRVQPEDGTQPSTMVVVASESSVEMLRRDGRVAGVERVAESSAVSGFGAFSYDGAGNITAVGEDSFIYDHLGRLKKATLGTNTEEYTYDRYGNIETVKTGTVTKTLGVQASSNRMNQATADLYATYDARGNVTQTSAGATFAYDGTDVVKASTFDGANHLYLYTAGDERIGTITSVNGNIVRSDWTVRDPSGKVLRRFAMSQNGTWTWEEDYIYRDGQLLAAEVPRPEKTLHFHLDHLGTPRVITGNGGAQIAQHTYYPFGTELTDSAQDPEPMKFTGHERDASSLDYMHARYYNAVMGRFLSVDPTWESADLGRPQSWNRYAYVENNPVNKIDPDGRCGFVAALFGPGGCAAEDTVRGAIQDYHDSKEAATVLFERNSSVAERFMAQKTLELIAAKNILMFAGGRGAAASVETRGVAKGAQLLESATARGRASETRVLQDMGMAKNTQKITIEGRSSIPDGMDATRVVEIKDTKVVSNTEQLRIQRAGAQTSGREHIVVSGTNTRVTKPVQENSTVFRRDDLGPP